MGDRTVEDLPPISAVVSCWKKKSTVALFECWQTPNGRLERVWSFSEYMSPLLGIC